ncbi:MAG: helix-turn-helix transcriptional regulator [Pseudonocardiaceae bacterium]
MAGGRRRVGLIGARKAAGHTQESLAAELHVDRSTVIRWEAGDHAPLPYLWPRLARLLSQSQEQLRELIGDDPDIRPEADRPSFSVYESLPSSDVTVARSQEAWRKVRSYLRRHGVDLAKRAARLYDPAWRVSQTPTLALPGWLPSHPVPIASVMLKWIPEPLGPVLTGQEAELRAVLPLRAPRHAFPGYASAIRYLDPPSLFENRPSYRLLDVFWEPSGQGTLQFGLATFFDKLDVAEALSHEFAAAVAEGFSSALPQLPFRALLSRPFDLSTRMATTSIDTLTLRRNTTDGSCTFLLLDRDPAKVAVGGSEYGVIPAGEFQPASISPNSTLADLNLWRNVVREYGEELLGQLEHDGSSGKPLTYECWPFYHAMQRAREAGHLRAHVLGVVLHALSLNPSILTAVIIDDIVFDDLFRDLVAANGEGRVVKSLSNDQSVYGLPFTEATVRQFLDHERIGGTSAACLALAWQHRESLV